MYPVWGAATAILTGCGGGLTLPSAPGDVRDAAMLTVDDLATNGQFSGWGVHTGDTQDEDLPECRDLTSVEGGPSTETQAQGASEQFAASSSGTTTVIHGIARNAVLVYPDVAAAEAAVQSIDADLYAACIAPSVTPDAVGDISVEDGGDYPLGDESVSYTVTLDDYQFFEGTDNTHAAYLIAVRVQYVVIVFEFVYGGQYFDDVDPDGLQRASVAKVTSDVEEAI